MTPITIPCRSARIRSVLAPYGHVLVLVKRVPQSGDGAGVFLAIDGQPDGTVARKRFWRGNFLFAQDPSLGSPGFKRFRPIVREKNGVERRLTNAEIAKNPSYGDFRSSSRSCRWKTSTIAWTIARAARSGARAEGCGHIARGTGEHPRGVGREWAQGSEEASTCKRHAPAPQRTKMVEYRAWFHERRRPPRG